MRALWQSWLKSDGMAVVPRLHEHYVLGAGVVYGGGRDHLRRRPRWLMDRLTDRVRTLVELTEHTDRGGRRSWRSFGLSSCKTA